MNWAVNIQKLRRAEAMTPGGTEEQIKEAYVKMGGKLGEVVEETPTEPEETIKNTDNETPPVAPPVKRVRKVKAK